MENKQETNLETLTVEKILTQKDFSLFWLRGIPVGSIQIVSFFSKLASHSINVKQMIQTTDHKGLNHIMFTISLNYFNSVQHEIELLYQSNTSITCGNIKNATRIIISGAGLRTHSRLAPEILGILKEKKITPYMVNSSELSLSLYVKKNEAEQTVKILSSNLLL